MADRCLRPNFMIWRVRWNGQSRTEALLDVESRHVYIPSHRTRLLLLLVSTFLGRHSGPPGDCFNSRARLQSEVFIHKRDHSRELPFHGVRHRALPRSPSCVQAITAVPYFRPTTPSYSWAYLRICQERNDRSSTTGEAGVIPHADILSASAWGILRPWRVLWERVDSLLPRRRGPMTRIEGDTIWIMMGYDRPSYTMDFLLRLMIPQGSPGEDSEDMYMRM